MNTKGSRGRKRKINNQKAVAYIRVSTDEQTNGADAQRAAIEGWSKRTGIEVIEWCDDIGVSGAAPLDERPGLLDSMAKAFEQRAGVLVVAKRDRLARSIDMVVAVERLAASRSLSIVTADGVAAGDDPNAVMMRGMLDLFAQYERAQIRLRTKLALAAKKRRGERVGQVPYGMMVDPADSARLIPDPAEQRVIAQIKIHRADGYNVSAIAEMLNAASIPSRGARWHKTTVVRILAREAA